MPNFLVYRTQTGHLMRAKVVTRHRDGDVTVEPWFWQDEAGKDTGCFQGGHKVRVPASYVVS